jgi:DNA-binding SARP family transcriptional activator
MLDLGHTADLAAHEVIPRSAALTHSRLCLLGGFELRHPGGTVYLPRSVQRLVAFLALRPHPISRAYAAGTLWLELTEERSNACLRSALWRLKRRGLSLIRTDNGLLELNSDVQIDVREMVRTARILVYGAKSDSVREVDRKLFAYDLLPDWYEDWVTVERDQLRQLRLHALESLSDGLREEGRWGAAVDAAQAVVRADPLRESGYKLLIRAHLAEGNRAEAMRQFRVYQTVMRDELGLRPSPDIRGLVPG